MVRADCRCDDTKLGTMESVILWRSDPLKIATASSPTLYD